MNATINMLIEGQSKTVAGRLEYVKAMFAGEPKILSILDWAISTREEAFGRINGIEITATVTE